ncbi:MAG: DUF3127 domain-containing protein [Chlorobi bacterium]|nr:MAG: DUF3127 domain-containing protein [Bacteroidota bacterium]KXK33232.1 MAG: hypothetical protein UZ06_CHB003001961 [Chlorobi bacterium OLB6]MBE2265640.1 DUF3127 domain-containing protein [Flavobacteriales bacterium]MBL1160382.1 DUF3127 domain-containing protein [Chlorobiota bacterium]MBW7853527.1 DUF3127 domain-containing protein [Candidatus Kapabacteria bacterium]MCC6331140.1 DUF3127 domain-containing protein [Ignavibacteria bacterium]
MANAFDITGTIQAIMDTTQVTDTFKKREFVLEIADGNYPQSIKFQVTQDRTALLDNYKLGNQVKVTFNLKGRQFQRKDGTVDYWLNLECWRIESVQAGGPDTGTTDYSQIQPAVAGNISDDLEDLPF